MPLPPSLVLYSLFPSASAAWGGSLDCLLFISPPGKLCMYDFLFSALVPKLPAVSCLKSCFGEADRALPSSCGLLSEQLMPASEGTKNSWKCSGESFSSSWVRWGTRKENHRAWCTASRTASAYLLKACVWSWEQKSNRHTHIYTHSYCTPTTHAMTKQGRISWENKVWVVYVEVDKQWLHGRAFPEEVIEAQIWCEMLPVDRHKWKG